jgi:hypothetical protein
MLLQRGLAKEALAAFKTKQDQGADRLHGFAGAAAANDKLGDKAAAKANYAKLLVLTEGSGSERPEIAVAKQYLTTN